MDEAERRTCARCGTSEAQVAGGLPAGWSLLSDGGGTRSLCPACTRANLRAIESRLEEGWWDA